MTREDRFTWKDGDFEIHHVTVRAIAIDADGNRLQSIKLLTTDLNEAAHRAFNQCALTRNWTTIVITADYDCDPLRSRPKWSGNDG